MVPGSCHCDYIADPDSGERVNLAERAPLSRRRSRLADGEGTLGNDERQLQYRLRNGQVRLATDAFFFQEGDAEHYETAHYGQFRVNTKGEPLLVALHDDELDRLGEIAK